MLGLPNWGARLRTQNHEQIWKSSWFARYVGRRIGSQIFVLSRRKLDSTLLPVVSKFWPSFLRENTFHAICDLQSTNINGGSSHVWPHIMESMALYRWNRKAEAVNRKHGQRHEATLGEFEFKIIWNQRLHLMRIIGWCRWTNYFLSESNGLIGFYHFPLVFLFVMFATRLCKM